MEQNSVNAVGGVGSSSALYIAPYKVENASNKHGRI